MKLVSGEVEPLWQLAAACAEDDVQSFISRPDEYEQVIARIRQGADVGSLRPNFLLREIGDAVTLATAYNRRLWRGVECVLWDRARLLEPEQVGQIGEVLTLSFGRPVPSPSGPRGPLGGDWTVIGTREEIIDQGAAVLYRQFAMVDAMERKSKRSRLRLDVQAVRRAARAWWKAVDALTEAEVASGLLAPPLYAARIMNSYEVHGLSLPKYGYTVCFPTWGVERAHADGALRRRYAGHSLFRPKVDFHRQSDSGWAWDRVRVDP